MDHTQWNWKTLDMGNYRPMALQLLALANYSSVFKKTQTHKQQLRTSYELSLSE